LKFCGGLSLIIFSVTRAAEGGAGVKGVEKLVGIEIGLDLEALK
jgi:hypothetical protein